MAWQPVISGSGPSGNDGPARTREIRVVVLS